MGRGVCATRLRTQEDMPWGYKNLGGFGCQTDSPGRQVAPTWNGLSLESLRGIGVYEKEAFSAPGHCGEAGASLWD